MPELTWAGVLAVLIFALILGFGFTIGAWAANALIGAFRRG